ncbi:MAG: hypothetical protein M1836_007474 [Candelina mexicana]|nr:MAG: hypothetical protein M1836_007474 [Candelina mexicana]
MGSPLKSACIKAMRTMEWLRITTPNRRLTTYKTPAAIFADQAVGQREAEVQPESPPPAGLPTLVIPRVYSSDDCAISLDFMDYGDDTFDQADVNAIRQTALAIIYSCVKAAHGSGQTISGKRRRGSGGWQIAEHMSYLKSAKMIKKMRYKSLKTQKYYNLNKESKKKRELTNTEKYVKIKQILTAAEN